jgi:uncharacterized protein
MSSRAAPSRALLVNAAELLRRPGSERVIDVELSAGELGLVSAAAPDPRFQADDRIAVSLKLESLNDGIVVLGSIDVPWHGACRRCLRELSEHTESEVDELYQTVITNPDAFQIVGDQLDLLPMVRELALLDAPSSPLCRDDCAGLCAVCGIDLNEGTCSCETPAAPSPWDVLDTLKAQLGDN